MKKLLLFAVLSGAASAQTWTDFSTYTASTNLSGAMNSKVNGVVQSSAPATCKGGHDTWTDSSNVFHFCAPDNTWNTISGSLPTQAANTILGNYTGSTATPTAGAAPAGGTSGCSGTADATTYQTNVGWGCHQITVGGSTTIPDIYWPFGGQAAAANNTGIAPGAAVQRVFTFTVPPAQVWSFGHFRTIVYGAANLYIAAAITNYAGTSIQTNATSNCQNSTGNTGNPLECAFAGTVTLAAGTYRLVMTGDASAGWFTQGGVAGILGWYGGTNSGYPLSGSLAVGTATNAGSGTGATLAIAVPLGTIIAETASSANNDYPVMVFNP